MSDLQPDRVFLGIYKGYWGCAEYNQEEGTYYGEVSLKRNGEFVPTRDCLSFGGDRKEDLLESFKTAVDEYVSALQEMRLLGVLGPEELQELAEWEMGWGEA